MAREPGTLRTVAWAKAGCPLPGEPAYDEFMRRWREGDAATIPPATPETAHSVPATPERPKASDGALRSRSGGMYLPWGAYLSPEDVRRMRGELVGMIETLAGMEHWPHDTLDAVMTRAMRGPLADLLPNLHHFAERLAGARAEDEARAALAGRTWRGEGFEDRRLK